MYTTIGTTNRGALGYQRRVVETSVHSVRSYCYATCCGPLLTAAATHHMHEASGQVQELWHTSHIKLLSWRTAVGSLTPPEFPCVGYEQHRTTGPSTGQ